MKALKISLALLIPLIILLFSFRVYVFDDDYYNNQFVNYDVISNFGKVDLALDNLFDFFQEGTELDDTIFSEREILHLQDVKSLILNILLILNLLFIIAFIMLGYMMYKKDYSAISFSFILGGSIALAITLAIIIISSLSFENMFVSFHQMAFSNDFWLLPTDSSLIKMFNPMFFFNITRKILLNSVFLSLFVVGIGIGAKYMKVE